MRAISAVCAAAALSFLAFAAPAPAAQPCWKVLINDWYDGRIDGAYPVSCYRDAIKNAPEDIKSYSSLTDDLRRAMQAAKAPKKGAAPVVPGNQRGRHGGSYPPVPATTGSGGGTTGGGTSGGGTSGGGTSGGGTTGGGTSGGGTSGGTTSGGGTSGTDGGGSAGGPFNQVISDVGPKNATSVPVPLIVLAAVALLLLAAGSAGFIVRRWRGQRMLAIGPGGGLPSGLGELPSGDAGWDDKDGDAEPDDRD